MPETAEILALVEQGYLRAAGIADLLGGDPAAVSQITQRPYARDAY